MNILDERMELCMEIRGSIADILYSSTFILHDKNYTRDEGGGQFNVISDIFGIVRSVEISHGIIV